MRRMYSKKQLDVMKKDITTLVDSEGHNRFEEWDMTSETLSGVTFSFKKVSLSGTHIMFVFAGEVASGR